MTWFFTWFATMDAWKILGIVGQVVFGSRFIVQWLVSERERRSVIPVSFWYLSIGGGVLTFIYAFHIEEPVFVLPQIAALVIYARNLYLVLRERKAA
jgi:lipid-A-disaccharide synthase-like uncharacterized protein